MFTAYITLFSVIQSYPYLTSALTTPGTYVLYGIISLLMAGVTAVYLPETNGKTSKEVLRHFAIAAETVVVGAAGIRPDLKESIPQKKRATSCHFPEVTRL